MPGKTILLLLVLTSSHQYNAVTDTDRISMHSHITRRLLRFVRVGRRAVRLSAAVSACQICLPTYTHARKWHAFLSTDHPHIHQKQQCLMSCWCV